MRSQRQNIAGPRCGFAFRHGRHAAQSVAARGFTSHSAASLWCRGYPPRVAGAAACSPLKFAGPHAGILATGPPSWGPVFFCPLQGKRQKPTPVTAITEASLVIKYGAAYRRSSIGRNKQPDGPLLRIAVETTGKIAIRGILHRCKIATGALRSVVKRCEIGNCRGSIG